MAVPALSAPLRAPCLLFLQCRIDQNRDPRHHWSSLTPIPTSCSSILLLPTLNRLCRGTPSSRLFLKNLLGILIGLLALIQLRPLLGGLARRCQATYVSTEKRGEHPQGKDGPPKCFPSTQFQASYNTGLSQPPIFITGKLIILLSPRTHRICSDYPPAHLG